MSAPEPVDLGEEERDLLTRELEALLPELPASRRQAYADLVAAVARGSVPGHLVPLLERVVAVALEGGRARRVYRAEGERVLTELFARTPRGQALVLHLEEVNRALASLAGRPLHRVRVGMRTLGHYTITLDVEGATITLAARPDGVAVESVAVGR
ncbi:MAG TPA: hypothetical protein VIN09_00725 [Chloroflexota bacterium]